jgi:hypothetical protein
MTLYDDARARAVPGTSERSNEISALPVWAVGAGDPLKTGHFNPDQFRPR